MLRLVARLLAIGFAASCVAALTTGGATAGTKCQKTDATTGTCLITVEVPGQPGTPSDDGPKDTGSGAACYWDGTSQGISKPPPGPVPCQSADGYWSNSYHCYIKAVTPPPVAGDPAWQGHQPGDGAIYNCTQPQTGILLLIWAQNPPPNSGAGPTPREVAQMAVKQMGLTAIEIGIAPKPGTGSIGLVGMPVWMWAANPKDRSVGPITSSATAGGMTVTATATLLHVTWDMGDGSQIVCKTTGTPYKPEYGRKDSPDCGYTYKLSSAREPGQAYTVTATSSWVITWAGAGQTGTIRFDGLNRSAQIRIGEAQVLVD